MDYTKNRVVIWIVSGLVFAITVHGLFEDDGNWDGTREIAPAIRSYQQIRTANLVELVPVSGVLSASRNLNLELGILREAGDSGAQPHGNYIWHSRCDGTKRDVIRGDRA